MRSIDNVVIDAISRTKDKGAFFEASELVGDEYRPYINGELAYALLIMSLLGFVEKMNQEGIQINIQVRSEGVDISSSTTTVSFRFRRYWIGGAAPRPDAQLLPEIEMVLRARHDVRMQWHPPAALNPDTLVASLHKRLLMHAYRHLINPAAS